MRVPIDKTGNDGAALQIERACVWRRVRGHRRVRSDGNDPVRYATQVANALGVDKDSTTIREVDDSGQLSVLQDSIAVMEGENNPGETLGYDSGDIPPAIQQLLA